MANNETIPTPPENNDGPGIMVLRFADSKIPEFKEVPSKDWILYGVKNDYPEYLTYLYNKSAKHNAIINGKTNYIIGGGIDKRVPMPGGFSPITNEDGTVVPGRQVNRDGETMFEVMTKAVKDVEIYGGMRLCIVYDRAGKECEIYHRDFYKFRKSKDKNGGFFYKKDWSKYNQEPIHYPEYDPNAKVKKGSVVFAYDEYRPGCEHYPLPGYVGCCNYLETDIEISKFHLSTLRNGMMPSKIVQFFNGDPPDEKKKEIEKKWTNKFGGSENAGKFIFIFNKDTSKAAEITDASFNELDKQFDILNETCQQEIISGHEVVSPMLFGVKTEGQLGGSTELKIAYEIFINTYAKPKQRRIEKVINHFGKQMGVGEDYFLKQLDPIGVIIPESMIATVIKPDEARKMLGLPVIEQKTVGAAQKIIDTLASVSPLVATKILDSLTKNEIRSIAQLPGVPGGESVPAEDGSIPAVSTVLPDQQASEEGQPTVVNDHLKNLTGKQSQQLLRIIRQYSKGQITLEVAKTLLKLGLGLKEEEINTMLGIEEEEETPEAMQAFASSLIKEDELIQMFDSMGDLKSDFHIVKTKKVKFASAVEAAEDELSFYQQAFKTIDVTNAEASILDLIKKDKHITPEVIAKAIGSTPEYVTSKIASLTKRGLIESSTQVIGEDTQIERTVPDSIKDIKPPTGVIETTEIYIKYSYEGPKDDRNRPFCRKLLDLDRLYSRKEIETMSQKLGYSVFDRRGGWWTQPDGTRSPTCRHRWQSNIVVKKGGSK